METKTLMFESIDKLAQKTGQKDLCEAVKKLYNVCFESIFDEDPEELRKLRKDIADENMYNAWDLATGETEYHYPDTPLYHNSSYKSRFDNLKRTGNPAFWNRIEKFITTRVTDKNHQNDLSFSIDRDDGVSVLANLSNIDDSIVLGRLSYVGDNKLEYKSARNPVKRPMDYEIGNAEDMNNMAKDIDRDLFYASRNW